MSTIFFIGPYKPEGGEEQREDPLGFKIDPSEYKKALEASWPQVTFFRTSEKFPLQWIIQIKHPSGKGSLGTIGALHANLQVISCDTPLVEFFYWHRTYVPLDYKLYLFDDSSWESLELTPKTTEAEIQDFVTGSSSN